MIATQAFIFTVMALCGGAAALLYGVLYVLRYLSHFNKAVCLTADFIAVAAAAALYYFALLKVGDGEMRLYTIIGFSIGFSATFKITAKLSHLAPAFRRLCNRLGNNVIIKKIFK